MYSFCFLGTTLFALSLSSDQTCFLRLFSFSELKEVKSGCIARSPPPPILSYLWLLPSFPHTPSHVCAHTHHTPSSTHNSSWWSQVEEGPPDAIFGLVEAHKKDPRPNKVTLAIGAYRDDKGRPFVLPTVKKVLIHK